MADNDAILDRLIDLMDKVSGIDKAVGKLGERLEGVSTALDDLKGRFQGHQGDNRETVRDLYRKIKDVEDRVGASILAGEGISVKMKVLWGIITTAIATIVAGGISIVF